MAVGNADVSITQMWSLRCGRWQMWMWGNVVLGERGEMWQYGVDCGVEWRGGDWGNTTLRVTD